MFMFIFIIFLELNQLIIRDKFNMRRKFTIKFIVVINVISLFILCYFIIVLLWKGYVFNDLRNIVVISY
jgi:hypothetical protein